VNTPLATAQIHTAKVLDPRLLLRWSYVGRIAITLAIFFAVGFVFQDSTPEDRLVATLLLVGAAVFTAISAAWSEFQDRALNDSFVADRSCSTWFS
jgi:hypothetical protein